MASYYFKALASDGRMRTGTVTAETDKRVATELRRQGLTPIFVSLEEKKGLEFKLPSFARGRRADVLFFTQELSTLLNATIPLDRALSITAELTERESFRFIVHDVLRVLKGGKSLADSLATHPEYFGELYVNMVRAGEASGSLAVIFERLGEFERTRDELRNYIISSLVYPALLTLVGCTSIFILLKFVVPRFAEVFEDSRVPMPLPTQIMMNASHFVETWGVPIIAGLFLLVLLHQAWIRTVSGRLKWDGFRLKIPLLGIALRKAETARFARAMGTLVAASVPLVQCINISRAILNNRRMARSLESVAQGVKRGEGISGPLKRAGEFPPLASHLLMVGEETGRIDTMFVRMAEIYEVETKNAVKRFTSLFEPLLILVMGIIVGALVLSLMLAITSVNDVVM
ncbi:MAG: type II secretion system F family protein [Bryobacteraceae bacterium]